MSTDQAWKDLHEHYSKTADWIDKPSLFALTAINYFPKSGKVLELGAGQGQDSRFFAEHGYDVVSTDIEGSALEINRSKLPEKLKSKVSIQKLDLREEFPFDSESFDIVYTHLSLHYFDHEMTLKIFGEIQRILKPGGVFAFFANSTNDPEYGTGKQIEPDFFQIDNVTKRYFSIVTARKYARHFEVNLLDDFGETYKDSAKDVHNLIRFIGRKPLKPQSYKLAIPFVGGIVERQQDGKLELLIQTRWKQHSDPKYSGTFEFPAGVLDEPYENVYDALAREIAEESGLTLKTVKGDSRTQKTSPQDDDEVFGFRPFCCTQQLREGKPWIGFIFICEVEPGVEPKAQLSESKDAKWMPASEIEALIKTSPEKFFTLEVPAWEYYFSQNS